MKKLRYIWLVVCMVAIPCICGHADNTVDDVYYWLEEGEQPVIPYEEPEPLPEEEDDTWHFVTITFIEDSITLHSDTVVRALIHRE